jgi:peptidyl-prolyl cis-trans isomerase SurA
MNRILSILALVFIYQSGFSQTQIDRVAAIVGQEVILISDIEAQHKLMESQSGGKMPENARCIIFDQLLSNALILSEAEKDSVMANESEVETQLDSRIREILRYMNNDPEQFKLYYGRTSEEVKDEMRDDMRKQLVIQKMSQQIMQSVSVTPKEVKEFFERIPKDSLPYFNSEVELGEIVVKPKVNAEEDKRAREKAEDLRRQIVEGADFAELAKKFSDDKGTAVRGGDLGITSRGSFVPEFEAAAYSLDKMEISQVVKSEFGYHVIQLLERLGNNISTRHILIKAELTDYDQIAAKKYIDSPYAHSYRLIYFRSGSTEIFRGRIQQNQSWYYDKSNLR